MPQYGPCEEVALKERMKRAVVSLGRKEVDAIVAEVSAQLLRGPPASLQATLCVCAGTAPRGGPVDIRLRHHI